MLILNVTFIFSKISTIRRIFVSPWNNGSINPWSISVYQINCLRVKRMRIYYLNTIMVSRFWWVIFFRLLFSAVGKKTLRGRQLNTDIYMHIDTFLTSTTDVGSHILGEMMIRIRNEKKIFALTDDIESCGTLLPIEEGMVALEVGSLFIWR